MCARLSRQLGGRECACDLLLVIMHAYYVLHTPPEIDNIFTGRARRVPQILAAVFLHQVAVRDLPRSTPWPGPDSLSL
jgi:hypothetical protein